MTGQCGARVHPQNHALPSSVSEILVRKLPQGCARLVQNKECGVEPHGLASLSQPPVQFVILRARQRLVVSVHRLPRLPPKRSQDDTLHRPLGAAQPVSGSSDPQRRRRRHGDDTLEERGADRLLAASHVARAGPLQGLHGAAKVSGRQLRAGVATHDHVARSNLARRVDAEGKEPLRVGDDPHRRVPLFNYLGSGGRFRAVGYDHLQGTRVVLGQHGIEGFSDRGFLVASRDDDGDRGRGRFHADKDNRQAVRKARRPRLAASPSPPGARRGSRRRRTVEDQRCRGKQADDRRDRAGAGSPRLRRCSRGHVWTRRQSLPVDVPSRSLRKVRQSDLRHRCASAPLRHRTACRCRILGGSCGVDRMGCLPHREATLGNASNGSGPGHPLPALRLHRTLACGSNLDA